MPPGGTPFDLCIADWDVREGFCLVLALGLASICGKKSSTGIASSDLSTERRCSWRQKRRSARWPRTTTTRHLPRPKRRKRHWRKVSMLSKPSSPQKHWAAPAGPAKQHLLTLSSAAKSPSSRRRVTTKDVTTKDPRKQNPEEKNPSRT